MKRWLREFGLFLARLGGWDDGVQKTLDFLKESYERVADERRQAEQGWLNALVDQERAAAQLRAYVAPVAPVMFHRAKELCAQMANNTGVSGEAKRHQVYARLRKEFPNDPHRDLGLAIELALR